MRHLIVSERKMIFIIISDRLSRKSYGLKMNNRNNFLKQSASPDYSNAFRTPRVGIHLKALFETKTMVYYTMRFMLFVQNAYTPEKMAFFYRNFFRSQQIVTIKIHLIHQVLVFIWKLFPRQKQWYTTLSVSSYFCKTRLDL